MDDTSKFSSEVLVEAGSTVNDKREVVLTIIKAGWGNAAHGHYYPSSALREAGDRQTFSGTKMFIDHLSESQRRALNGLPRSVRDLVGRIKETWWDEPSQSLKGRAKLVPWFYDLVASDLELVEASINAAGRASAKMIDGKQGRLVESIEKATSVDWVVVGGAGGKVDALLESHMEDYSTMMEDLTVDALVESRPDIVKSILEGPLNEYREAAAVAEVEETTEETAETVEETPAAEVTEEVEETEETAEPADALTEAAVQEMVEKRAQEIAQSAIDTHKFETAVEKKIDALTEAAEALPPSSRKAIRQDFQGRTFDSLEALEESLTAAIKERELEIEEAFGGVRVIEGLGASAPSDMQEAASRPARSVNSFIDDRLGLDSPAPEQTETVAAGDAE